MNKGQGKEGGASRGKKKLSRISSGVAHIQATFNNTIVTITDNAGSVVSWASAGKLKFAGSKKSSAFVSTLVGKEAGRLAMERGMKEMCIIIRGPGAGREGAVRGIQSTGIALLRIEDRTPIPHNGCRRKKIRRV